MFGKTFGLEHILKGIKMAKPSMIRIGTHHYVRLSESSPEDFGYTQEDLESIEILAPFGGAVPQSCEQSIKKMFKNMKAND